MNKEDFKKKIMSFGNDIIDKCFPCDQGIGNKLINNTCKYIYKIKANELDGIISMFADANGDINVHDFVEYMQDNLIGDGLKINFRDYVDGSGALSSIVPNKTLVIRKEDLIGFLI